MGAKLGEHRAAREDPLTVIGVEPHRFPGAHPERAAVLPDAVRDRDDPRIVQVAREHHALDLGGGQAEGSPTACDEFPRPAPSAQCDGDLRMA